MNLQGFYTNKGLALAAKIAGGTASLTITRVVAGSGHTANIPSATSLPDIKQTLAEGTAVAEGATATLPVTLAEAQAASSYSLTELGVYATDPDEGEVLMQVYQLDTAAAITAGGESVLRFYLRQSIGALGVTVTCSPAGILVDEDLAPTRGRVMATTVPSRTVTVAASELRAYLNSLPRMLTEELTINVSGTCSDELTIYNFYGPGYLTLDGGTYTKRIRINYCTAYIWLKNCVISNNGTDTAISIECSRKVSMYNTLMTGSGNKIALEASYGSLVDFNGYIKNFGTAVYCTSGSIVAIKEANPTEYSGNVIGASIYQGGIVLNCLPENDTLGGASNSKIGGIIAKRNGTLL